MSDNTRDPAFEAALQALSARGAALVEGLAAANPEAFFQWWLHLLRDVSGASHAVLAWRQAADEGPPTVFRTWRSHVLGGEDGSLGLDAAPFAPASDVGAGPSHCSVGARQRHPEALALQTLQIEAFASFALRARGETATARCVLLFRDAIDDSTLLRTEALFELLRPRAESELGQPTTMGARGAQRRAERGVEPNGPAACAPPERRPRSLSERRRATLEALTPGLAHDLNNLLCCIHGNADLLRLDVPTDAVSRSALQDCLDAAERAGGLCRQVLSYAHGRLGAPRSAVVGLRRLLQDLQPLCDVLLGSRARLTLGSEIESAYIPADATVEIAQLILDVVALIADEARGHELDVRVEIDRTVAPGATVPGVRKPRLRFIGRVRTASEPVSGWHSVPAERRQAVAEVGQAAVQLGGHLQSAGDATGQVPMFTLWLPEVQAARSVPARASRRPRATPASGAL